MNRRLDVWAINFVSSGRLWYSVDHGPKETFEGPAVFCTQPGHHYEYGPVDERGWDHSFVSWRGPEAAYWAERGFFPARVPLAIVEITDPTTFRQAFDQLLTLLAMNSLDDPFVLHELERVLLHLHCQPREPIIPHTLVSRVQRLAEEVRKDPCKAWDFRDEATKFGCTIVHFRRLWKQLTNESPLATLNRSRLNKAATQLRAGEEIQTVCLQCGFQDQRYFARLFRRQFNLTPSAYRQAFRAIA